MDHAEELVVAPGVFDAFTALLVQRAGFPTIYLSGNALGIHLGVGQPLVTLTETINIASRVTQAVDVPVILDGATGFGGPVTADRLIRECEKVGVAAVHIDDQPDPRMVGYHFGRGQIIPVDHAQRRMAAVVASRRDESLAIFARTDVLRVTGCMEETVERCRALLETGVDGLIVLDAGPDQGALLRASFRETTLVWIGAATEPGPTRDELSAAGFDIALYPFSTVAAVYHAVMALWRSYAADGILPQTESDILAARHTLRDLIDLPRRFTLEQTFTVTH